MKDFNAILSHWNDLRVIQLSSQPDFDKFHLSLNSHESLEKIVIPSTFQLYFDHTFWGIATKYYIVPSHLLTPADIVRNVIEITTSTLESFAGEFALRKNDWDLTNLESLQICVFSIFIPKTEFLLRFKNLKNLEIFYDEMDINYLLDILHFLGNTKTLNISASLEVRSDLDDGETKDIFNKALELVNEKFPLPDVRIRELHIYEDPFYMMWRPRFSISYGENGATLTTIEDNSDSESDISGSIDESVEKSDSMNESVEDSDSVNESVTNSDSEDMNEQE